MKDVLNYFKSSIEIPFLYLSSGAIEMFRNASMLGVIIWLLESIVVVVFYPFWLIIVILLTGTYGLRTIEEKNRENEN